MFNTDLNGFTKWKEKEGKKRKGNEEKGECLIQT